MKFIYLFLLAFLLPHLSYSAYISDFSPISHWTCDETSGVRYDSNTTNANDLTDNNTVLYDTGLKGNACDFERDNSESLTRNSPTNMPTGSTTWTMNLWHKAESIPGNDDVWALFGWGAESTKAQALMSHLNLSNTRYFDVDLYGARQYIPWVPSTGTWYMLTIKHDPPTFTYYVDGVSLGTDTDTINLNPSEISVGRNMIGTANTQSSDGLIDEISVFPTALTGTDITTLYNSGVPLSYVSTTSTSSPTSTTSSSSIGISADLEQSLILGALSMFGFFLFFIIAVVAYGTIWTIRH